MNSSAVRLPISVFSSFQIRSSSHKLRPPAVTYFLAFTVVGGMGDRGRLSASRRGRSSFGDCSGSSGCGDEGTEEGIRILEQEGMLQGGAMASPLLAADGLRATTNGLDVEALWAVLGSVFNAVLSVTLKRVVYQERPVANLRLDPGMPSSHAQSISFVVAFAIVTLFQWVGFSKASLTVSGILLAPGVFMSWLRVSQQLHTTDQVIVGGVVGTTLFLFWYILWRSVISRAFDSFLIVRVLVVLGAACSGAAFVVYTIRNWLNYER